MTKARWTKTMRDKVLLDMAMPYLENLYDQMFKEVWGKKINLNPNRTKSFLMYVKSQVRGVK